MKKTIAELKDKIKQQGEGLIEKDGKIVNFEAAI